MRLLAETPVACVALRFDQSLKGAWRAEELRGAVGAAFAEHDLLHQHPSTADSGGPIRRYPRVQYRWRGDAGLIFGIGEGAELLVRLPWLSLKLKFGDVLVGVTDAKIETRRESIAVADRLERYRFRTPWLALNQENYVRFRKLPADARVKDLDRILVGNCLSALGGLGVRVDERIYAAFQGAGMRRCKYKGIPLVGYSGSFVCNLVLPTDIGLGRAVSHGYGWVTRQAEGVAGKSKEGKT